MAFLLSPVMAIFLLSIVLVLVIGLGVAYLWVRQMTRRIYRRPTDYPNPANQIQGKITVVCAGDSITHGNVSYNWVNALRANLASDYHVFNAGINSDLSYTLLGRIDEILAVKPDVVIVMIGTNDVNAKLSKQALKRYYQQKKIAEGTLPTLASYQANVTAIVKRIKNETTARVAVMSLPVMGEDLSHQANLTADTYSAWLKKLADEQDCAYLPVRERMKAFLMANPQPLRYTFAQTTRLIYQCIWGHYVQGKTWDELAQINGFQLVTDNLHLNSAAGDLIVELVAGFVKDKTTKS